MALMVGTALDTNGQKARYVEAAKRWGDDPDVLKVLWAGGADLAGTAARFAAASQRSDERLVIRSAHRARYAYFRFPGDIAWDQSTHAMVRQMAREADVLHLTNNTKALARLKVIPFTKPAVLHHHGTLFRANPQPLLSQAKRMRLVQAVSTIDLMRPAPEVLRWMPAVYDMDMLDRVHQEHRRESDGTVRIVSAPTNRAWKSTSLLIEAVKTLKAEGLPVELELIENRTWKQCLRLKAAADIYFDQVILGYGCNAVEAWGMGIPVIAGADDWTLDRMCQEWDLRSTASLPFYSATEATITDRLREMVEDKALRTKYGARGRKHAHKYHAEKPALTRLAALYAEAQEMQTAGLSRRDRRAVGIIRRIQQAEQVA